MPHILQPLKRLITASTEILFQTECVHCHTSDCSGLLCEKCEKFDVVSAPWCLQCGHPTAQVIEKCGYCAGDFPLESLRSYFWLSGAGRTLLLRAKYFHSWEELEVVLNAIPSNQFSDTAKMALVPVPLDANRYVSRGFNQAEIISRHISTLTNWPVKDLLTKTRPTEVQSLLTLRQRKRNLRGAFSVSLSLPLPKVVLLIDDVYTTGKTLNECAKTLKKAGVEKVYGWTLFRTPTRTTRNSLGITV